MKSIFILCALFTVLATEAQELYVYTDPASNIPARSLSAKVAANYTEMRGSRFAQRYQLEGQAGINKRLMLRAATGFSDMHSPDLQWESVYLYGKYRFFSADEAHRHLRMAIFAEGAYSRNVFEYQEVNLNGDKSGVQLGAIATGLWNRFALSATVSHTQVLHGSRGEKVLQLNPPYPVYQVMNYSLSGGYLLLPVHYRDYRQTNLNLYAELLAQQGLDRSVGYIDFAPAIQLIFNSNTKLNLGYRMQLTSDMDRMSRNSVMVSVERTFLNALRKRS